jgi:lipopolysaccharide export system protein LptA
MGPRPIAIALVAAVLAGAGRLAADPPAAGENLEMAADRLDLDVEAKTAVLTGRVRLARGAITVRCPRVDVRYDHVPHVTWAKGTGGVIAEVKGVKAEAPEVELDLAAKTMELRGGVKLTRGEGWITAERASVHLSTAKVTLIDVKGSIPLPKGAP